MSDCRVVEQIDVTTKSAQASSEQAESQNWLQDLQVIATCPILLLSGEKARPNT